MKISKIFLLRVVLVVLLRSSTLLKCGYIIILYDKCSKIDLNHVLVIPDQDTFVNTPINKEVNYIFAIL